MIDWNMGSMAGGVHDQNTTYNLLNQTERGNMKDEHPAWLGKIGFLSRT